MSVPSILRILSLSHYRRRQTASEGGSFIHCRAGSQCLGPTTTASSRSMLLSCHQPPYLLTQSAEGRGSSGGAIECMGLTRRPCWVGLGWCRCRCRAYRCRGEWAALGRRGTALLQYPRYFQNEKQAVQDCDVVTPARGSTMSLGLQRCGTLLQRRAIGLIAADVGLLQRGLDAFTAVTNASCGHWARIHASSTTRCEISLPVPCRTLAILTQWQHYKYLCTLKRSNY